MAKLMYQQHDAALAPNALPSATRMARMRSLPAKAAGAAAATTNFQAV
jgi:hypothetical protein